MDRATGEVGGDCLREIRTWLADFLDLEPR
jgi:hypothetical protein